MRSIETSSALARAVRTAFAIVAAIVLSGMFVISGDDTARAEFQAADIAVTVTDTPDPVVAGADVTYMITVTNNGPDGATNALMIDPLPAGTTFVSSTTPIGWSCVTPSVGATGTLSCNNAFLSVGSAAFTVVLDVGPATPAGTVLTNTVTAASLTADPDPGNSSATATTTVSTSADVGVTLNGPSSVNAGADLTYTMTTFNLGPSDAAGVSLTDTLPAGTTFVSLTQNSGPSWSCSGSSTVSCTIATFASGASSTFDLVVHVGDTTAAGAVISDTVVVATSTSDGNSDNDSSTSTSTVSASADLGVTVVDSPDPVTAGSNLTYTIAAGNSGPSAASSVSLVDVLPAGTTFESLTSPGGWSCTTPAVASTGTISCTAALLGSGGTAEFTLVVAVPITTGDGAVVTNTATVASATIDPNGPNDSATATTTVSHINAAPVAADDPDAVMLEDDAPLSINVLANDTDADLDPLTIEAGSWTQGAHGVVECAAGACTYTPELNFHGIDTFTYEATDGTLSDSALVTVTVFSVNDPPVTGPGGAAVEIVVDQDGVLTFDVLAGASDADGDPVTVVDFTQPAHGVVACASGGACTYTPNPGYVGPDSFTYTISDGTDSGPVFGFARPPSTAVGTVTITVTPLAPVTTTTTVPPTTTTEPTTTTAPATTAPAATTTTAAAIPASPLPVDLPETGSDVVPLLLAGLTFIAAGIALARRGRPHRSA